MTEKTRTVQTPFFTSLAAEILDSALQQLSDGWGERNLKNEGWWRFCTVKQMPDGRVVLRISTESGDVSPVSRRWADNRWYWMSEADVLKKFAEWLKKTVKIELDCRGAGNVWSRQCEFELQHLSASEPVRVKDVYFVYDTLLGRDTARRHSAAERQALEGCPRSEAETATAEQKERALEAYTQKLSEGYRALDAELEKKIADLKAECDGKKQKLQMQLQIEADRVLA